MEQTNSLEDSIFDVRKPKDVNEIQHQVCPDLSYCNINTLCTCVNYFAGIDFEIESCETGGAPEAGSGYHDDDEY